MHLRILLFLTLTLTGVVSIAGIYLPQVDEGEGRAVWDRTAESASRCGRLSPGMERVAPGRFALPGRQALRFPGQGGFGSQVFTIPPDPDEKDGSIAFQAWFKPEALLADHTRLVCLGDETTGARDGFRLYVKEGRVILGLDIKGKRCELGTPASQKVLVPGKWVHVAAAYHRGSGVSTVSIDGRIAARAVFPKGGIRCPADPATIGNRVQGDRGFIGLVDEMQLVRNDREKLQPGHPGTLASGLKKGERKFEWEGSTLGIVDSVPAPWDPVQVRQDNGNGLAVVAAGKRFLFKDSILPEQIIVGKIRLLARPFQLFRENRPLAPVPGTLRIVSLARRAIRLSGGLTDGEFQFTCEMLLEFDGLCTLSIGSPDRLAGRRVADLHLEIRMPCPSPLLAKVGGHSGYLEATLRKAWPFPLWFGTEEAGMTVYAESDQGWVPTGSPGAFELAPERDVARLRVNFIGAATVCKAGSRFVVSFQPTPVREFPRERPDMGMFHGAFLDMEKTPGAVNCTYDAEGILDRRRGTLDMVVEPCFDPGAKLNPGLGKEPYVREMFSVVTLGQEHFRLCYSIPHGGFIADEGIQPTADTIWDGTRKLHFTAPYDLKQFERVRLTLAWGDGFLTCHVNARPIARIRLAGLFRHEVAPDLDGVIRIRLGESICNFLTPRFGSGFRIHGIRLLRSCRPPSGNGLEKTPDTLLLDRFSGSRREGQVLRTIPEIGPAGVVSAGGTITGGALDLFQDRKQMRASCLDRILDTGSTTLVFHQGWSAIQSHCVPVDAAKLKALIDACHRRGIKLLLYFGFELSDRAPEFAEWHRRVLRLHPDRPTPPLCQVRQNQKSGKVCYGSCWQDFITWAIARTWERFDFDGVFLDAAMVPYPCPNELHGCGWRDSSGRLHATMPMHRYVEMIRRIHRIVKAHGGIITGNQAVGPLWAYADSVWVGEGYKYKELAADPGKAIPLPEWRIGFSGRAIGVPGELLLYEYPPFWRRDSGWALAGLHGMFLRPEIWWKGSYLEKVGRMRRVFMENHLDQAEFIGHYRPDCPVSSDTPEVKASAYRVADGWLFWIANLGMKRTSAVLRFALPPGRKHAGDAEDPMTGAVFRIEGDRTVVPVRPYDWRMLKLIAR